MGRGLHTLKRATEIETGKKSAGKRTRLSRKKKGSSVLKKNDNRQALAMKKIRIEQKNTNMIFAKMAVSRMVRDMIVNKSIYDIQFRISKNGMDLFRVYLEKFGIKKCEASALATQHADRKIISERDIKTAHLISQIQ